MRLVVLLGIAALGCRAAVPYDRLRVELSTTSECVKVDIEGAEVLVDWWAPEYMIPDVYTDAGLRLEQPWQMAVPLSVTFDLIVSPSSGPDEPRWSLSHGTGGQSSVVVLALAGDGSQPTHLARASLHELREGEDSATRTVVVPAADVVACAAPSAYCIDPESGTYAAPETHLDLSYAAVPTVDPALLSLDLSLPARDRSAPPPLVVCIHGGNLIGGDKDGAQMYETVLPIVGDSYAAASINYRLAPAVTFPAAVHDVHAAIRWIRANAAHYGYDGDRIALWGFSAGGTLTTLVGLSEGVGALDGQLRGVRHDVVVRGRCHAVLRNNRCHGTADPGLGRHGPHVG